MRAMITAYVVAGFLMGTAALAEKPDGTIVIGVLNDQSGLYSDHGGVGSVWAAKKAVEDFGANAKGIKVEIISADHQNKADIGAGIARRWFDVDGVDAIADGNNSAVALAIGEIATKQNKVILNSGAISADITGKRCNPNTVHWVIDTWALANGTGKKIVELGGDTWFMLTADYAFGHALEADTTAVVKANGGKVVGSVRTPFPATDFSSFLIQAQASNAKIIGLANSGGDTITSIKQAAEFGIVEAGQKLAGLLVFLPDVRAIGLESAQGLLLTEAWYWDHSDANRAFAEAFARDNSGKSPSSVQAGVYSSVVHYLKAVEALKSPKDGLAVVNKMKEMPTEDALFGKGLVRVDGRKIHDLYLYEVKSPDESKKPDDFYKLLATIPASEAFRPLDQGGCPLVRK